jgi:hypothetical protein
VVPNRVIGIGSIPAPGVFGFQVPAQPGAVAGIAAVPAVVTTADGRALPGVVIGIGNVPGNPFPPVDVWPQSNDTTWPSASNAGWPQSNDSAWSADGDDEWPQSDDDEWLVRT